MQNRLFAITQAVASVRAEGLEPSLATQERLDQFARGTITEAELKKQTLEEMLDQLLIK